MKELKEIRFNETDVILKDNLVRGAILPMKIGELNRNIIFAGDTVVEGAVYANKIEVRAGNIDVQGALFAQNELYVNSDMKGRVDFRKSVGSANTVVSRAAGCELTFHADINARAVSLHNALVCGSIYADEVELNNCVVIGGIFATGSLTMKNSMAGTFNSPAVCMDGDIYLLLPSAFSIQPLETSAGTRLFNLTLADLGHLFRGLPQEPDSGCIAMNPQSDEVKSTLTDEGSQRTIFCYTVAGKVLAADIIDTDKFQNHFLLSAASLGSQLLKSYDLGTDAKGAKAALSTESLRRFFFDILQGRISIQPLEGNFDLAEFRSGR